MSEPIYKTDFLDLYHADCMDIMKEYPDKYFDLAIVDPPYGINYAKRKEKNKKSKIKYTPKNWDNKTPNEHYFNELFRVSKYQIIWGGNYFLDILGNSKGMICWDKCQPEGLDQAMCEFAWTNIDKSAKIIKTSIQQIQFTRTHPTEKPTKLYEFIIKHYANQNAKILDTHFGSGSIALAVDKANRLDKMNLHLTACEIDKDYIEASIQRISQSIKQQVMVF